MARGDQADFLWRLKATLPPWFGELASDPVISAILSGLAWTQAQCWSWWTYVRAQGRIGTASGANLDDIAQDFFGYSLARAVGETDDHFRARIKLALLQPKGTRAALLNAVQQTTGFPGILVEPWNPLDCGGYACLSQPGVGGGVAYGSETENVAGAGGHGSLLLPYQAFLTCYRPPIDPPAGVTGYASLTQVTGCGPGGYGTLAAPTGNDGAIELASYASMRPQQDEDIQSAIANVLPIGTVVWLRLTAVPPTAGDLIDDNFFLDESKVQ
jgi:hypothetical protein